MSLDSRQLRLRNTCLIHKDFMDLAVLWSKLEDFLWNLAILALLADLAD